MNSLKYITQINIFKTIYTNFRLLPFKIAIKFPIIIGNHVKLDLHGTVKLESARVKPGMISFGIGGSNDLMHFNSRKSYFGIKQGGVLIFKGKAHFAVHSSLLVSNATMIIGENFSCNNGTKVSCIAGIEFGNRVLLGTDVLVMDSDGHKTFENNVQHPNKEKIKVGNHVWLTSHVSVLKGTTIADDVVVGYGSLVVKDIQEEHVICAGVPAKIVKRDISWER